MPTTSDYLTQLQQDREDLVDNLEEQGISDLTGDETFTELVPRVLDIETGGGGFQPRLPSEYQEVEYIQGTGTQYINTQYKPNQDTKTEISVETINLNTTFVPFGTRANAQLDYVLGINFNSQNYIQYNTNTAIYATQSSTPLLNTKFTAILSKDEGKITYINTSTETSTDIVMTPTTTSSFTCITNLYLGCLNNNGSTQYLSPSYKIYYCKIWENGILIKNLVPCYRKSDNEVGLYDLVNNSFLVNAGTGTFIKGNNHDTPLINLQNKTVTITGNTTTNITADGNYEGLNMVSVITNVPSGGDIPEKGVIFSEWDSSGYPTKAQVVGLTYIPNYHFASTNTGQFVHYLQNIVLPNNISSIGGNAFYGLGSLNSINLPDTITSIGVYAFNGCTNLTLTSLPSGLTFIPSACFSGCINLALTSLPSGITIIGPGAFSNCSRLSLTSLPNNLTTIDNNAFYNCSRIVLTSLPSGVTTIGQYAFSGCTSLTLTSLPSGLTSIGQYTFQGCTNLALTSLPSGITMINTAAFINCTKLALTSLPDSLTTLVGSAFSGCTSLKKISMNNVQSLYGTSSVNGVFRNCSGLKQVWVGSAITNIGLGRYAFSGCSNLEKMYINLPRATVETFGSYQYAFMNDTTKTGIIVCNDDANFITKEEFDAIDVDTL